MEKKHSADRETYTSHSLNGLCTQTYKSVNATATYHKNFKRPIFKHKLGQVCSYRWDANGTLLLGGLWVIFLKIVPKRRHRIKFIRIPLNSPQNCGFIHWMNAKMLKCWNISHAVGTFIFYYYFVGYKVVITFQWYSNEFSVFCVFDLSSSQRISSESKKRDIIKRNFTLSRWLS